MGKDRMSTKLLMGIAVACLAVCLALAFTSNVQADYPAQETEVILLKLP